MLDFRKLDAYRYAVALLELVSTLVDEIPRPQLGLGECLGRAALSLLRSLAEGSHRQPTGAEPSEGSALPAMGSGGEPAYALRARRAEAGHCYAIARASAFECVGLIDTLDRMRAVSGEDAARTREVLSRLVAMLSRLEADARSEQAESAARVLRRENSQS
jgi:hypothetical protein